MSERFPRAAANVLFDALASPHPLPAGGAAAAVAVGMGASLGVMAARISRLPGPEARLLGFQAEAARLAVEDCAAFEAVLEAGRSSPPDDAAKHAAWRLATVAPIEVGEIAAGVIAELDAMRDDVRPSLACDVGAARQLTLAGALASAANACENVRRVDASEQASVRVRLEQLQLRLRTSRQSIDEPAS